MTRPEAEGSIRPKKTIGEGVSTRAIEAFMANYRDAQVAFLDLIDNAVDNRIEGKQLLVRVTVAKNQLVISNQGGEGLDFEGLQNYFIWGHSEKVGKIGHYGVGGKAAMGFLARSMELICSGTGEDVEYQVEDPNWETRDEQLREYEVDERKANSKDGYFRVRLTNLKREVNSQAIITRLGDFYRPLLLDGSVKIIVNNREVAPLQIKYLESDPNFLPQPYRVQTRLGDTFIMKVGVLDDAQKGVRPGLRCYYRGRLIEDEQFFGHPTPAMMPQASKLIGEVDLAFVEVTPNKANFIKSSVQWDNASRRIHTALEPWYAKLAKMRMESKSQVENYEKELAKRAKRVLEHVLATTGLLSRRDLPGESSGRLPPTTRQDEDTKNRPVPKARGKSREGRTAPLLQATVGETVKRWGALFNWDVVSMGVIDRRGEIIEENGQTILKINSDYPLYQAAKKAGDGALEIYMAETAGMKLCELTTKGRSIEEYVDLLNQLLSSCGNVYRTRIREQKTTTVKK